MQIVEKNLDYSPEVNAMVQKQKDHRAKIKASGEHDDMELCKDVARYMVSQEKNRIRTTSNYDPPAKKLFRNMSTEQRIADGWILQKDGSWIKR